MIWNSDSAKKETMTANISARAQQAVSQEFAEPHHLYKIVSNRESVLCLFAGFYATLLGYCLGFLTESNKPYSVNGVTGPILKSTTEVTWAGSTMGERVSHPVRGRLLATQ